MQASLSPSTRAHYERAWKKLMVFQNTLGLASQLPVSVSMLLLFIANLHANGAAPASIVSTVSAVAYFHKINGFPDPSHCFLVAKGEHAENEHWRLVEDRNGQVGYAPAASLMVILDTTAEEEESSATKKGQENSTDENQIGGWVGQEGERRKSYSAAVIDGIKRNSRIYVGDSIVRKTDTRLSKEEDVVVCLPGARIEHVTERVEKIMGRGKGGTILVHIGTNNADKEGTTAIVDKYRKLLKKTKEARVEQIILSGILPVFGNRLDGYRNAKRMAINGMVKRLCMEEDVGYVDLWDSLVGKEEMYARDGLHLSGKGAAVFAEGLSGAVASGLGKVRYLN